MKTAIRKHLRDVLALAAMAAVAIGVASYILGQQGFRAPGWVPVVGDDRYVVEAAFSDAQAVVAGQGQTVNIAGVAVGDVTEVRLEDGRAIVRMDIERRYAPVFRDATILLRPRTPLKDMYLSLDPGSPAAGEVPDGGRLPVSSTAPDIDPDEILAELDTDVRDYLRVLLSAGSEAFRDGEPGGDPRAPSAAAVADLQGTLKRFEPLARDGRAIGEELAKRRRNIARAVHSFGEVSSELAAVDDELGRLVGSLDANFGALASQDANIRAALERLPGALRETELTLRSVDGFSRELGPAMEALAPFARELGPALRETRGFMTDTTPVIRDRLRPFSRDVRPVVRELRPAARDLGASVPRLSRTIGVVDTLLDTLAYNPPGREEGYLFWASWLNHVAASAVSAQDAHGALTRGVFLASCPTLQTLETLEVSNEGLRALLLLLDRPDIREVCPQFAVPELTP